MVQIDKVDGVLTELVQNFMTLVLSPFKTDLTRNAYGFCNGHGLVEVN